MRLCLLLFSMFLAGGCVSHVPASKVFPELEGIRKGSDVSKLLAAMGEPTSKSPAEPDDAGIQGWTWRRANWAAQKHCTVIVANGKVLQVPDGRPLKELQDELLAYRASVFPQFAEAIRNRRIVLGMSSATVVAVWGPAERINRTVSERFVREQWVYGSTYLYFENQKLVSFQESTH